MREYGGQNGEEGRKMEGWGDGGLGRGRVGLGRLPAGAGAARTQCRGNWLGLLLLAVCEPAQRRRRPSTTASTAAANPQRQTKAAASSAAAAVEAGEVDDLLLPARPAPDCLIALKRAQRRSRTACLCCCRPTKGCLQQTTTEASGGSQPRGSGWMVGWCCSAFFLSFPAFYSASSAVARTMIKVTHQA
jgi:hypothetical protein